MIISCPGIFILLNLHNFLLELHVSHVSKGKLKLLYLNNVLTKCNKQIKIVQNINIYWCLQLHTKKDQKFKLKLTNKNLIMQCYKHVVFPLNLQQKITFPLLSE